MKKKSYLYIFMLLITVSSCEEVVNIELKESEPRLVIDASIIWPKGTEGNDQQIRISKTASFYGEEIEGVGNASVKITSEEGVEFSFLHTENGYYVNSSFQPVLNTSYELEVLYQDQTYTATENLIPVTDIDYIEQKEAGGFSGEEIEIKAFYTDPADEENYYLFKFRNENINFEIYEDEFTNGNSIFGYYSTDDIEHGDIINIQMEGISKAYYEYLFILRSQVGSNNGGPFETMPATVKGNIINRSDEDNYPFGYFRLSEADSVIYKVE